jgi:ligand-binding sensor domain-containing protein/serine phosphatase RsbU (regulator of sigma subunit)
MKRILNIKLKSLVVFILLLVNSILWGQQFNFQNYNVEEGLPQSTVYEVFQDHDGFLWIGTDGGGLCRYDGYRFKIYGKREGLNANVVRKVAQDSSGILWVATNNGLFFGKNEKFFSFDNVENNRSVYFFSVFIDSKQNIWAAGMGKGLYKLTPKGNNFSVKKFSSSEGLSSNYIFDVCEDGNNKICIASFGNGLDILDPETGTINNIRFSEDKLNEIITLKKKDGHAIAFGTKSGGAHILNSDRYDEKKLQPITGTENDMVWSITADDEGKLWASTDRSGIVSPGNKVNLNTSNGLSANQTLKVLFDREKNLWIGTNGSGLAKYPGSRFLHITGKELKGLSQVTSVIKQKGTYWAGTALSGLYNFTFSGGKIREIGHFTKTTGLPDDYVSGLIIDKKGLLWIATRNGICSYNGSSFSTYTKKNGLVDSSANCIYADSRNRIWTGTSGGLSFLNENKEFVNISESNGLINNEVQAILEDVNGNIWIATFGGLVKFDGTQLHSFFEEDGLTERKILSLTHDRSGNIFIGTFGGGIYKFDAASKSKTPVSFFCGDESLLSNNIYSMLFLGDTILLAATNHGINKIAVKNNKAGQVKKLDRPEGFMSSETSQNAIFAEEGSIWLGTPHGITIYYPAEDMKNSIKPRIRLTSFKVNGHEYMLKDKIRLASSENSIKAEFVSVSLTNPAANEYLARLTGLDTAWTRLILDQQNLGEFISVEFKKLQPGKYKLQLKARNNDKVESGIVEIPFTIRPPFYKTWWFIMLCTLGALALMYSFFKFRERQLIHEKMKLEAIVTARTAEVVASKKKIEAQKDLLQMQKLEITDSINYSKRIQNAILPEKKVLQERFPESFILYRPKDIVSGDFYYFSSGKNLRFYIAVADCTGHGVPGAFMSMLGSKELSEAIKSNQQPSNILNSLNIGLKRTLNQNNPEKGIRDGMDIGLVMISEGSGGAFKISFSGANRPLWILRKGAEDIIELKPTKAAIGGYTPDDQVFGQVDLEASKGDVIYLFSDGFADQFGGESGKKMMTRRLKEKLLENRTIEMPLQANALSDYFDNWKGSENEQVDDVLIIGVKL